MTNLGHCLTLPFTLIHTGTQEASQTWGERHIEGTFFLKKKGEFSKNKKGISLFSAKSWRGHVPPPVPPVPTFLNTYIHIYIHMYVSQHVYIQIYRDEKRKDEQEYLYENFLSQFPTHIYIFIYINCIEEIRMKKRQDIQHTETFLTYVFIRV